MATVRVLCSRMRVEEKQIAQALAEHGQVAEPVAPAAMPIPPMPSPIPPAPAVSGGLASTLVIDRVQERAVGSAMVLGLRSAGMTIVDAGLAATGDRLLVASALASAGVARPETVLAVDDEAAMSAVRGFGYPATLMPLSYDGSPVTLLDVDTAEAVIEHRLVLGAGIERVSLVQRGSGIDAVLVIVVGGIAVAVEGGTRTGHQAESVTLAEQAAAALGADVIGVRVATVDGRVVVWDVEAVPDFRHTQPLNEVTAAEAIASLVLSAGEQAGVSAFAGHQVRAGRQASEGRHGVVLSA